MQIKVKETVRDRNGANKTDRHTVMLKTNGTYYSRIKGITAITYKSCSAGKEGTRPSLGGESTGIGGYRWTARHAKVSIPTNKCPKNPPSQENTIKMIIYQSKTHTATKCSQI